MAGIGPLALLDRSILEVDSQALQTVVADIGAAQRRVVTIDGAIAAYDAAALFPQVALAWSLFALIGSSLLTVATGTLGARRFIVRQSDRFPETSADWRRLSAPGGWIQVLTAMLVSSAVAALRDADDKDRYGEEWAGDMSDINGKWRRAWWAITLRISAPHGINAARKGFSVKRY